jgi:hypothetical protein
MLKTKIFFFSIVSFLILNIINCSLEKPLNGQNNSPSQQTLNSEANKYSKKIVIGPWIVGQYEQGFPIHGIAGDTNLIFILQVDSVPGHSKGVYVMDRNNGMQLGQFVSPPDGFLAPLAAKLVSYRSHGKYTSGRLLILDAFPPELVQTAQAAIYDYNYSYSPSHGFTSRLTAGHQLPKFSGMDSMGLPNGMVYPGSLTLLPDGNVAVVDMIAGGTWVAGSSLNDWHLVLIDQRLAQGTLPGPITGFSRGPDGNLRPFTFLTPSVGQETASAPGAHAITYVNITNEVLFLVTAPPGGIFGISLSTMLDTSVSPFAKSANIREVVPPTPGISDYCVGMDYDRFNPATPWVYWQNASEPDIFGNYNIIRRVNLLSGAIEEVASSWQIYDWVNEISVLPPRDHLDSHFTYIVSANMQEANCPSSNILLKGVPAYVGPSIVPIVAIRNR